MGWITTSRRRQIRAKGRTMRLSRAGGAPYVDVIGYAPPPQSAQLIEGVAQAAFICQITNDELTANPDYGYPTRADRLTDGPSTYVLTDARPVYDGATVAGWTLVAMGGENTS